MQSNSARHVAAGYMIGYVIVFSFVPLFVDLGLNGSHPLLFNAGLAVGKVLGVSAWLAITCRHILLDSQIRQVIRSRVVSKAMLLGSISHFTFALFAWSTTFIDTAISTIVYETWPILYMALLVRLGSVGSDQPRYRKIIGIDYLLCGLAFVGLAYVTVGTSSIRLDSESNDVPYSILGIALAVSAAGIASLNAYNFQWGVDLRRELPLPLAPRQTKDMAELACVMIGFAISSASVLPVSLAIGFAAGGQITLGASATSLIAGAGLLSLGSVLFRRANLETTDTAVNALSYLTPIVALLWLAIFSDVEIINVSHIVVGATAIVAMNLLLNVDPEEIVDGSYRLGFRALVLSLWISGAVLYSRDEWFTVDQLRWMSGDYWTILTLSATVFTLVLSLE